jgi:hypothetical protein
VEQLLERIEELRYQLYLLSKGKDLIDPEVVQASQNLDCLLNEYYSKSSSLDLKVG